MFIFMLCTVIVIVKNLHVILLNTNKVIYVQTCVKSPFVLTMHVY